MGDRDWGMIRSYRDLDVWNKSMSLVVDCYRLSENFPRSESYGLTSQLRRAAVSIPANIAEGHARKYTKEFLHHLSIACGSLAELETHLQISRYLGYSQQNNIEDLLHKTEEINRMLYALRRSLEKKI